MTERQIKEYPYGSLTTRGGIKSENQTYFGEITKRYPYNSEKPVVTFSDLDGVFLEWGENNSWDKNIERLMALRDIARESKELIFWTSRIRTENVSFFPFISRGKMSRFKDFVNKANPDCEVSFICGPSKMIDGNGFDELVKEKSNSGCEIVVLGSSIMERGRVDNLINKGIEIYHYNTGGQYAIV